MKMKREELKKRNAFEFRPEGGLTDEDEDKIMRVRALQRVKKFSESHAADVLANYWSRTYPKDWKKWKGGQLRGRIQAIHGELDKL